MRFHGDDLHDDGEISRSQREIIHDLALHYGEASARRAGHAFTVVVRSLNSIVQKPSRLSQEKCQRIVNYNPGSETLATEQRGRTRSPAGLKLADEPAVYIDCADATGLKRTRIRHIQDRPIQRLP